MPVCRTEFWERYVERTTVSIIKRGRANTVLALSTGSRPTCDRQDRNRKAACCTSYCTHDKRMSVSHCSTPVEGWVVSLLCRLSKAQYVVAIGCASHFLERRLFRRAGCRYSIQTLDRSSGYWKVSVTFADRNKTTLTSYLRLSGTSKCCLG